MSRRRAREFALQMLFQIEMTGSRLHQDDRDAFWKGIDEADHVRKFTDALVTGTTEHISYLDETIRKVAEHWHLERMAVIDRNILRLATYELLFLPDIPYSVTINEAIEIARKYSTEESASFINGILDRIAKKHGTVPS